MPLWSCGRADHVSGGIHCASDLLYKIKTIIVFFKKLENKIADYLNMSVVVVVAMVLVVIIKSEK